MPTDFGALNNYFSKPLSGINLAPAAADVAKFIALNSQDAGPSKKQKGNDPSVMSRIFDILSRPNYAVANFVQDTADYVNDPSREYNGIKSLISGLAGTQKTTFQDVLKHEGAPDSLASSLLGLGLDIGLDPTTYIPGPNIAKLAGKLGKGAKVVDKELPLAQKLLDKGEPVNPELFGIPKGPEKPNFGQTTEAAKKLDLSGLVPRDTLAGVPKKSGQLELDLPGVPKSKPIDLPNTEVPKGPVEPQLKGQKALDFGPEFNVKQIQAASKVTNAEQIIDHLKAGDIEKALEIAPPLKAAPDVIHDISADEILKKLNQKSVEGSITAKQQANLWNKAQNIGSMMAKGKPGSKAKMSATQMHTEKIYNALEQKLVAEGKTPRISTGENVSLSDIVGDLKARGIAMTPEHLADFASSKVNPFSEVGRATERMRARGAINDSIPVKQVVDAVSQSKGAVTAANSLSDASANNFDKFLKDFAKNATKAQAVSPAGQKAANSLVNTVLNAGKSSAQIYQQGAAHAIAQVVASGKVNTKVNHGLTLALEKDLGKIPKWAVNDNKAMEFIMGRVATWWGQSDLRPLTLNAMASSAATSEARGKVLMRMFAPFTPHQQAEAFRIAQGVSTLPSSPEVGSLAGQITDLMSDLANKTAGNSVLIRSAVDMGMLNKWMRRYKVGFEFSKKSDVAHPITGESLDFSKGTDWLDSWKVADPGDNPATLMFKTMEAVEQATREKAVFDDLGERFGSTFYGKEYRSRIQGHPYLDGYYFPEDIAKQIPRMVRDWSVGAGTNNQFLHMYDKVLSMWKTLATIYRPAHHIRNLVGDVYLGMLDGVNSVKPYSLAVRALRLQKDAYPTMKDIDRLVELGVVSSRNATPLPGQTLFHTKAGIPITAEQVYAVAHQKGLFESVATLEDIIDLGSGGPGWSLSKPLGGAAQRVARGASELENSVTRMAHFIDVVMKSKSKDLPAVFEEAAQRTRKFHPSGLDLTDFEKKYMRRIIPFYSWMRKSTPVLLEGMVMKPGITLLPSKVNEALQMSQGIDTTRDNPFPVDQLLPQWIRDEGIGPVALPDSVMSKFTNQKPEGYVQAGVGLNPISQLIAEIQHPGKTIGSGLTPAIQIPLELGITGRKTFTGEPITGSDARPGALPQYIGEQIPVWSAAQGMLGITPFGTDTKRGAQSDNQSGKEALFNWLSGLGIKGTGPYVKSARYEKFTPIQQDRAAKKQDFIAELKDKLGG